MIISKNTNIKINGLNKNHYLKYFPNVNINDIINVPISILMSGSHALIEVKCDDCEKTKFMMFNVYKRYGDNYLCCKCVKKITKETNLKKYGFDSFTKTIEYSQKSKKTSLKRYGVEYPLQNKNILEKQQNTNIKKYGTNCVSKNKEIRDKQNIKRIINIIDKYKKDCDFVKYDIENKEIEFKCNRNHIFKISRFNLYNRFKYETILCTKCNPLTNRKSGLEQELKFFLIDNKIKFEENKYILDSYEIDIYLPDFKLGIEFNGVYWHNELYKSRMYHFMKTEIAEKKEIHLVHIYEDDWLYKKNIVKSEILRLLNKIKLIDKDNFIIKEINDLKVIRKFLDLNHIKGFTNSKLKLGVFLENELIGMMLFNKYNNNYKIIRHCIKINFDVENIYKEILNYLTKYYKPTNIIWELDRSWETKKLPESFGFSFFEKTKPNYYYVIGHKRYNRLNYKKNTLVRNGKNPNLTEHEIMLNEKIYRIYDSGNLIYINKNNFFSYN